MLSLPRADRLQYDFCCLIIRVLQFGGIWDVLTCFNVYFSTVLVLYPATSFFEFGKYVAFLNWTWVFFLRFNVILLKRKHSCTFTCFLLYPCFWLIKLLFFCSFLELMIQWMADLALLQNSQDLLRSNWCSIIPKSWRTQENLVKQMKLFKWCILHYNVWLGEASMIT